MKLTASMMLSVDGVYQGPGGPDEDRRGGFERGGWTAASADPEMWPFLTSWFERADALLLGRKTWEILESYWPLHDGGDPVSHGINVLPKYVPSTTLKDPTWQNTHVIDGDVEAAVRELKAKPGRELQVHGSGVLLRWLLERDLVDELNLRISPVIVGDGLRLFPEHGQTHDLELVESRAMPSGVMIQTYRPNGRATFGRPTNDHEANGPARHRPLDVAGRHDRQGKPGEGRGGRQAGLRLHRQPAGAATLHRRTRRCPGRQDAAGAAALREVGHGVVRRRRRLVLRVRRLRRPRQARVRARHGTHARTAGDADRDGQGDARRGARIRGRHRRAPARVVDEAGHGHPRFRETVSPARAGMTRYLVLLRGINVGGRNKVPMAALRDLLESHGHTKVSTYIASGNVILSSDQSAAAIKRELEEALPKTFKLDSDLIAVLVLTRAELRAVVRDRPKGFGDQPDTYHSDAIFLMGIDAATAMQVFDPRPGVDEVWPGKGVIYSQRLSAQRTKSRLSKIMGTPAYKSMTIRNWATTMALLERMEAREDDA